jgi:hypothetical protein
MVTQKGRGTNNPINDTRWHRSLCPRDVGSLKLEIDVSLWESFLAIIPLIIFGAIRKEVVVRMTRMKQYWRITEV